MHLLIITLFKLLNDMKKMKDKLKSVVENFINKWTDSCLFHVVSPNQLFKV